MHRLVQQLFMQTHLLEEASAVVKSPQLLVNIISRRVRQLTNGHRPLVEVLPKMGFADIALSEVIQGKLNYEFPTPVVPQAILPSKFVSAKRAA